MNISTHHLLLPNCGCSVTSSSCHHVFLHNRLDPQTAGQIKPLRKLCLSGSGHRITASGQVTSPILHHLQPLLYLHTNFDEVTARPRAEGGRRELVTDGSCDNGTHFALGSCSPALVRAPASGLDTQRLLPAFGGGCIWWPIQGTTAVLSA